MNYEVITALINQKIKENDTGFITGEVLNLVLRSMVETTGAQEGLMGIATPSTVPSSSPDAKQHWFATAGGNYSAFNSEYNNLAEGLWLFTREFIDDTDEMRWVATDLAAKIKGKDGKDGEDGEDGVDGDVMWPAVGINEQGEMYIEVEEGDSTNLSIDEDSGYLCMDMPEL